MVVIDANLLLYGYDQNSPFHAPSQAWLTEVMATKEVGLPLQSALAFIRITTNRRLRADPKTMPQALAIVDGWLAQPNVRFLQPGPEHWAILKRLCTNAEVTGDLTTDAHLAALAIEHQATLYTTDRDFARFQYLRWQNPLVPA